jgi:hypothetical protein
MSGQPQYTGVMLWGRAWGTTNKQNLCSLLAPWLIQAGFASCPPLSAAAHFGACSEAETSGPAAFSPRTTSLSIVRASKQADAAEERFFQKLEAEVGVNAGFCGLCGWP